MILLALLLALAQQDRQPTTHDQAGVSQPSPGSERPDRAATDNVSDKAQALPQQHPTELQGTPTKAKKAKRKHAKSSKPMPEASAPPSGQNASEGIEREGGKGKAPKQPKPIGEKSTQ